jgi:hypothetical protein
VPGADALTGASYPVSGFSNGDRILFRVRATDRAGLSGDWTASDGVTIDTSTLPAPTIVGEGVTPGTDDPWSNNNVYYVYWNIITSTGSPITYIVQRCVNGGACSNPSNWVEFTPTGLACDSGTGYCSGDDPVGHAHNDIIRYRVRAENSAGSQGNWSAASSGIRIDTTTPESTVTTSGLYNLSTWPGHVDGGASDIGSSVRLVNITIYDSNTHQYWDDTTGTWVNNSDWLTASVSPASWSYLFAAGNLTDGHTYLVESRATDVAGNEESVFGANNFTYSSTLPGAPAPTASPHLNPALWYDHDHPTFQWTVPSGGPILGYSYLLDQSPGAIPDDLQEPTGTNTTYTSEPKAHGRGTSTSVRAMAPAGVLPGPSR